MPAKRKPAAKAKRRAVTKKAPVYFCRDCGLEVTVVQGRVAANQLICCTQPMKRR
jgi:hypothetical protein